MSDGGSTVRVAEWVAPREIAVREVAMPTPQSPHDVVVEVVACGICGSDVHRYVEGAWAWPGMRLGHEFAGVVRAVGAEVNRLRVGERVAVNPAHACGGCRQCETGYSNLCADRAMAQGGLGEQVLLPAPVLGEQIFLMPHEMTFEEGAFLEPLSVAVRAVRQAAPDLSGPVAVLGLGTIGQCVVRTLLAYGAKDIVGVDTSPVRLSAAEAAGAIALRASADLPRRLADRWGRTRSPYQVSGPLTATFECSGAEPMLALAIEATRAGGFVSLLGLASRLPAVDVNAVVQKELRVLGSFAYTGDDTREAFRLLSEGAADVSPLVSHRVSLSRVSDAFEQQHDTAGSIKVMVYPDAHLPAAQHAQA